MQVLKILFLGANPRDTTRIRIDEELREIEHQLRLSVGRDRLSLGQKWAVRPDDLQQSLVDNEPQIVHFSGHSSTSGICLEDEQGDAKEVNAEALSDLFSLFKGTVKCVVLNACYSEAQAAAISQHVPYVIGMNSAIPDDAATHFSVGFYRAIAAGKTVEFAFNLGVNAIKLEGLGYEQLPKLLKTTENLVLLQPLAAATTAATTTHVAETIDAATVKRKWAIWGILGGVGVVIAGLLGYFFGENKPVSALEYRISNATMDLHNNKIDSFKITFDVIADNNTQKDANFVRDSFSLQLPNSDITLRPLREGRSRFMVKTRQNINLSVAFVIPATTKSGNLALNIARPNGVMHIDYLYGAPIALNDKPEKTTDSSEPIAVLPSENQSLPTPIVVVGKGQKAQKGKTTQKAQTVPRPSPVVSPSVFLDSLPKSIKVVPANPKPEPSEVTVVIPTQTTQGDSRRSGGTIKFNPVLLERVQQVKKTIPLLPQQKMIVVPPSRNLQPN